MNATEHKAAGMIYSHRDFYLAGIMNDGTPYGGLDKSILGPGDQIQYDTGTLIPWFASLTYGVQKPHGPFRKLSEAAQKATDGIMSRTSYTHTLVSVDKDGTATILEHYLGYAPGIYKVWTNGWTERVDAPYGNGERSYDHMNTPDSETILKAA